MSFKHYLSSIAQKAQGTYKCDLEGTDVVKCGRGNWRTQRNHPTWTGNHYPATCPDPDFNPDRRGDKRAQYPLSYPGPNVIFRGNKGDLDSLFHFSMKFLQANRIAPDGTPHLAASHLGLYCFPMSHTKDDRLI